MSDDGTAHNTTYSSAATLPAVLPHNIIADCQSRSPRLLFNVSALFRKFSGLILAIVGPTKLSEGIGKGGEGNINMADFMRRKGLAVHAPGGSIFYE